MHTIKTEYPGRKIVFVNPEEKAFTDQRFVLWVGEISPTYLVIWADSLESAAEVMCDWCVDHAPGLLCDDSMREEYDRAIAEGKSADQAMESAEMDVTVFGHSGYHGINSDHWGIQYENPSRADMLELLERN